jgi:hypothetical protein
MNDGSGSLWAIRFTTSAVRWTTEAPPPPRSKVSHSDQATSLVEVDEPGVAVLVRAAFLLLGRRPEDR